MNRTMRFFSIALSTLIFVNATAQKPMPKLTNRSKKGIMTYLENAIKNEHVIVGQQVTGSTDVTKDYNESVQKLFDSTGKYPALLGLEYGFYANVNLPKINDYAIKHWNKGGLVTISWHADCPWVDGYNPRWHSVKNKDSIDLKKLLKTAPESKEKNNYRTELASIANALKHLKEAGVMVLWRPFHEASGPWFWWSVNDKKNPTNQQDFAALWKDMYETLTKDFGIDNLLWVFSPNTVQGGVWPPINSMYPDPKYVDIVGVDAYTKVPEFSDYEELKKFKKLVVNGEIGPSPESYGIFDQMEVLNVFKGKAAYFLQWSSWTNAKVSIVDNHRYKEMMNAPAAITLDKLK